MDPRDLCNVPCEREADDAGWQGVKQRLGLDLPAQYKNLIDSAGDQLSFGETHVLSPFASNKHLNMYEKSEKILAAARSLRAECSHHYPLPLYPEDGGLFPWAITDNGDTLYWITREDPDTWPTLIQSARAPEFEVHFSRPCSLLYRILTDKLQSAILA